MPKVFKLITAIAMILTLCSCTGEEPDNIAYVTALGIDKTKDSFVYTIQFAQPVKISGGAAEEGGSGGQIVENISVEAPSIYSAINNANMIISKDLSLSHAKVFVISEDVAKKGLGGINDVFSRNNDIRPDIYFVIAENAGKYLEEVKPTIELNPVKYYQLIYESKNGTAIAQNTAVDFYTACISKKRDCLLPYAGVAKTEEKEEEKSEKEEKKPSENKSQEEAETNKEGFEDGTKNYIAGQAGKKIANKSEALGAAVFKGDKYLDRIGSTEAELYNILSNEFREMNTTFYSEMDPEKPVTISLEEKSDPRYVIDKENKHVDIYLKLEGEILSLPGGDKKDMDEAASKMISTAAEKLIDKLYGRYNADVLGICGRLKRQFLTTAKYESYCKEFNPYEWSFSVKTDMVIKRTGMTYY